ncbi:MAG TPA: hypothetical protein IAB55_03820 [Candidatus Merdivicinus faecavium]|nr:hypothetical protein [Candidatus Merdivicinus faecavium]
MSQEFFLYKGRPLVRLQDTIYYGRMSDPYVVMLQIRSHKQVKDLKVADEISVQMMATDLTLPPQKLIAKRADRHGLYQALDIASVWLDRECGAAK